MYAGTKRGGAGRPVIPSLLTPLGQSGRVQQPDQREGMELHSTHLDPQLLSQHTHTLQAKLNPGGDTCKSPCFSGHQISPQPQRSQALPLVTLCQLFSKLALTPAHLTMSMLSRNPCIGWLGVSPCPGDGRARPVSPTAPMR